MCFQYMNIFMSAALQVHWRKLSKREGYVTLGRQIKSLSVFKDQSTCSYFSVNIECDMYISYHPTPAAQSWVVWRQGQANSLQLSQIQFQAFSGWSYGHVGEMWQGLATASQSNKQSRCWKRSFQTLSWDHVRSQRACSEEFRLEEN